MDTAEYHKIYDLALHSLINQMNMFREIHNIYEDQPFILDKGVINNVKNLEKRLLEHV